MKITLTGINFNYTNGYNNDYTGVNLNFSSSGATFSLSGYVTVTKDEYTDASGNPEQLTALIIQKVQESLNTQTTTQAS
ncbi:hypothetical protein NG54_07980 [Heyndrickxia ginsengihumi]|uniref:Uncharacterized protein n=1 Tax=Heyndrickxia ginsengihumi TaxID=363870 RepID=A0A0A6VDX3_9BACI|nr:hypothetical protein [Heyndrickxia ginsengihumi]KHD85688.1 hypothetical protein NG54_07980 [Heyndrickxia ginsengihumi]